MSNEKEEEVREPYWEFMARELREFWKIEDDEESMLDQTFNLKNNSRLSCQIEYTNDLDGIILTLAPE